MWAAALSLVLLVTGWESGAAELNSGTSPSQALDTSLPPAEMHLVESALPAYEREIDHAGILRGWNDGAFQRGREIYQQICHSCHGDLALPGSIPLSLRFGEGRFAHGNDPFTMYRTITRGWRLMAPQVQLVPREKYDVIHYIREAFLREHNPSEYFEVTREYLANLPAGTSTGPAPVRREPWKDMDYGNFLIGTFEITDAADRSAPRPKGSPPDDVPPNANIAYKAIAIRLDPGDGGVSQGNAWIAFEHDTLRVAGVWTGDGFIDWHGINFDGRHVVRPRTVGDLRLETTDVPGWANPNTGTFDDPRIRGLDGRPYGPLPRNWTRYKGLYRDGSRTVVTYSVGDATVLETHDLESTQPFVFIRTLNLGKSTRDLAFRASNTGADVRVNGPSEIRVTKEDGWDVVRIPASATPLALEVIHTSAGGERQTQPSRDPRPPRDLRTFTTGGPARWTNTFDTVVVHGPSHGAFAVDSFPPPSRDTNPWKSWMRLSGLDFLPGTDAAVVCTWDGDVWRVDGITGGGPTVRWTRVASGLFQPLGIKVVNGVVVVSCRDQLVRLRDLNGDGETDFYECLNSDHQVTEHFHEFAMGLQADDEGNLYYAKSARHARPPLVPHHGTLLKVSADGATTEILANGFRAANGVCRNPDGSFIVTDQEGHWNPMNRINWVVPGGRFFGNMWSYGAPDDPSDSAMEPPLCWVDKATDRSPSELLWVDSNSWGALHGSLLNLSYGYGRIAIVPHERVGNRVQGGVAMLPIPDFPTGVMRGRFHPGDGNLYVCGMAAWGTEQMHLPGGFYRVRATGRPAHLPVGLRAHRDGIAITFSDPIDATSLSAMEGQPPPVQVRTWALKRSAQYGSKHYDEKELKVAAARLSGDSKTLTLTLPGIEPVWQMDIRYRLKGSHGEPVEGVLQNTIHVLADQEP